MENPLAMLRVLVAEDEYFIAQDITNSLALLGATVVGPVSSGNKALRAIAELDIDAAVLDLNLEGTIDFAVADELTRRNLPFVFATGYDPAVIPSFRQDRPVREAVRHRRIGAAPS
ncbi:response regulator [Mesorhizobium sp.]|uniref:response regulator n=1 Tax=Mesorhizobium sp. TaxID=1871066 RepID=UPI0025BB3A0B|nr:response regulator [Mesorhizobium sp.]